MLLAAVYDSARQTYQGQQCQARGVMWWPAPSPALLYWPAPALLYVFLVGGEAQLRPGPLKVRVVNCTEVFMLVTTLNCHVIY